LIQTKAGRLGASKKCVDFHQTWCQSEIWKQLDQVKEDGGNHLKRDPSLSEQLDSKRTMGRNLTAAN